VYVIDRFGVQSRVGFAVVTMVVIKRSEEGVPSRGVVPDDFISMSREIVPAAFRDTSKEFASQRLQRDLKPTWDFPIFVRYSDEDTNMHTNHASYFRFFQDAKLFAIKRAAGKKILGSGANNLEVPHPDIAELCALEIASFSVLFVKEVRVVDSREFYIVVQANKKDRILEMFVCAKDDEGKDKVYTTYVS